MGIGSLYRDSGAVWRAYFLGVEGWKVHRWPYEFIGGEINGFMDEFDKI